MSGFAAVGLDEALARARALVPALRERAARDETLRQMSKETLDDLHHTGLLRFHRPRRWGGSEQPFVAIFDIPAEIARQVRVLHQIVSTGAGCGGSLAEMRCAPLAERDGGRS